VSFDIPVGEGILWIILLVTRYFDLLETPLREIDIGRPKIAPHNSIFQPERRSESSKLGLVTRGHVLDNFDLPMILVVPNCQVSVAGNFFLTLRNRGSDIVAVKIASGLRMDQTDSIAVTDKAGFRVGVRRPIKLGAGRVEKPFIVRIFMVVARNLLLGRTLGIG